MEHKKRWGKILKEKGKKIKRQGNEIIFFFCLVFVENYKEKEKINFPLFGNYIEKLRIM